MSGGFRDWPKSPSMTKIGALAAITSPALPGYALALCPARQVKPPAAVATIRPERHCGAACCDQCIGV